MATPEMLAKLPKLDDDDDVNQEREFVVPRDGEPDLKFRGTLLASAAPNTHNNGRWTELRIYTTVRGKYVFSKIGRSVHGDERDKAEALVFDKEASVTPRSWQKAATSFFRYSDLAKQLYRKAGVEAEERID